MIMIDKGIKKNMRAITTDRGKLARKIFIKTRFIRTISLICLVILSFFEKPDWCLRDPFFKDTPTCNNYKEDIPNSNLKYLKPVVSKLL